MAAEFVAATSTSSFCNAAGVIAQSAIKSCFVGVADYATMMSSGYTPPNQLENVLTLVRQGSADAERAMAAAKYAEMAASAAGAAGEQAVQRAIHIVDTVEHHSAKDLPFGPATPAVQTPAQHLSVAPAAVHREFVAAVWSTAGLPQQGPWNSGDVKAQEPTSRPSTGSARRRLSADEFLIVRP